MDRHETRIYVGRLEEGRPEVYAVGSISVERLDPAATRSSGEPTPLRRTSSRACS